MEKITFTKKEVKNQIRESVNKFSDDKMMNIISNGDKSSINPEDLLKKQQIDLGEEGVADMTKMKELGEGEQEAKIPNEIVEIFAPMDEMEKILSRLATSEKNDEVKKKIFSFYEKVNKLKVEAMREFNISK